MITKYITESGSEYTIDTKKKTWQRKRGIEAATIRSESGTFNDIHIDLGDTYTSGIYMICPPYDAKNPVPRIIESTRIVRSEVLEW